MYSFLQNNLGKVRPELLVSSGKIEELKRLEQADEIDLTAWTDPKNSRKLFHFAAAHNQVSAIHFLASKAYSVINAQDIQGNTALHVAFEKGHREAALALLDLKVDGQISNFKAELPVFSAFKQLTANAACLIRDFIQHPQVESLRTPAHMYTYFSLATQCLNVQTFKIIYAKTKEMYSPADVGSILKKRDQNGASLMHLAARIGADEIMEFVFSVSSECGLINEYLANTVSYEKRTPLHYAVENDHVKSVRVLLQNSANCVSLNGSHSPPLHKACMKNSLEMIELMIDANGVEILQSKDKEGKTVLHSCAYSSVSKDMISLLIQKGAAIETEDHAGITPLANAIWLGAVNAVESLLDNGADPLAKDKNGCNALHLATIRKRFNVFQKVMASGKAKLMMQDCSNQGLQPIHYALKMGQTDMINGLLQQSESPVKDPEGNNYVHLAVLSRNSQTLPCLLSFSCSNSMINEPNQAGLTPLHYAATKSNPSAAQTLTNRGAIIYKSKDGRTPFMYACSMGNFETAKLLFFVNKFQRNWADYRGNTSLHLAVDGKNPDIVKFCLDRGTPITLNDDGIGFFDKIIDRREIGIAKAVLQHSRWEECLDIAAPDKRHSLVRLVKEIPEAYGVLLDQCYSKSSLDPTHLDYWEEFNFKGVTLSIADAGCYRKGLEFPDTDDLDYIEMNFFANNVDQQVERNDRRFAVSADTYNNFKKSSKWKCCVRGDLQPFSIIQTLVDSNYSHYLIHPVVEAFLKTKLNTFYKCYYLVKIFLHFILALMLTIFMTTIPQPGYIWITSNDTCCAFLSTGQISLLSAVLLAGLPSLAIALVEIIHRYKNIREMIRNYVMWINLVAAICSNLFVCSFLASYVDVLIWHMAALAACLTWLSVGYDLRFFNAFGIGVYITIIISTTRLAFKLLAILSFLFLAFAVPLYTLVGTRSSLQFSTLGKSVFSVFNYLIANLDVSEIQMLDKSGELPYPEFTYFILSVALILLPIITINVLIGLAVGDIDKIKKNALISQRSIEVNALAHLDNVLHPIRLCERPSSPKYYKLYPNHSKGKWLWIISYFYDYETRMSETEDLEVLVRTTVRQTLTEESEAQRQATRAISTDEIEDNTIEHVFNPFNTPNQNKAIISEDVSSKFL